MASGHVNRANRPNTWLLRPSLQSEASSCQPGAVHTWPLADMAVSTAALGLRSEKWFTLSAYQLECQAGIRYDDPDEVIDTHCSDGNLANLDKSSTASRTMSLRSLSVRSRAFFCRVGG